MAVWQIWVVVSALFYASLVYGLRPQRYDHYLWLLAIVLLAPIILVFSGLFLVLIFFTPKKAAA
jgi:hypothetical protein